MLQLMGLAWVIGIACVGIRSSSFPIYLLTAMPSAMVLLVLCCAVAQYLLQARISSIYWKCLNFGVAGVLSFALGLIYADTQMQQRLQWREKKPEFTEVVVYVRQLNQLNDNGISQAVEVLNRHPQTVTWLATLAQTQVDHGQNLELGHYYKLSGKIRPAHSYATAGAFDVERWYLQQNIMSSFRVEQVQPIPSEQIYAMGFTQHWRAQQTLWAKFRLWIEQQRYQIRAFIQQQPLQHQGLILALLTGDKSLLDAETEAQFQRFGISHLLAISGPHVLIFAGMLCWALHQLIRYYRPHWYLWMPKQYLLLLPFLSCVLLYTAFVGFEIPALRTLLMCSLVTAMLVMKQKLQGFALLIYSAALLLWFDPLSVLSAAFWLSYGACFILLRIYQSLGAQPRIDLNRGQQLKHAIKILIESQWKIFIALFPLVIVFFKQVAWIAPLSNIIAIPLIGMLIVPLDILAGICFFIFEPLASMLFQLNDLVLALLSLIFQGMETIFAPRLHTLSMSLAVYGCLCLGLFLLFLPRAVLPKTWAILCFVPLVVVDSQRQPFELTVLDVGQGQALFLRSGHYNMMIDVGGSYNESKFSIGQQILRPFLAVNGIKQLDQVVLSHLDQDHSGAFPYLQNEIKIQHVFANQAVDVSAKTKFDLCQQGQQWSLPHQVQIQVLSPKLSQLPYAAHQQNELSCVLYISVPSAQPYQHFLVMGDAGWATEYQLLQQYPDLKVDVLILGHHGSKHSSAYDFLAHFKPKLAVASAGFDNRYGHPSPLVQQRLAALNIPFINTIQQGSVRFSVDAQQRMLIQPYRQQKLWLQR